MIEVSLIEFEQGAEKALYAHKFENLPRIGEWIVLSNDKTYEVLMVLHHEHPESGVDVCVKYLGNKLDCVDRLGSGNAL
ncbi:hypothetical protein [Acinetobacter larvae]|uniref:hypothetical protein n=1 Tax=Acinetobacter larvae TaxID=1789224 RepID=UPI000901CA86|nr:hypothetical protein [Acinetobacter larvae]